MKAPVDLRIQQANERTLLAWIRTSVALMAFGFVVERFGLWLRIVLLGQAEQARVYTAIGVTFVVVGVVANVLAVMQFVRLRRALFEGRDAIGSGVFGPLLAIVVAVAGVGLAVYLVIAG